MKHGLQGIRLTKISNVNICPIWFHKQFQSIVTYYIDSDIFHRDHWLVVFAVRMTSCDLPAGICLIRPAFTQCHMVGWWWELCSVRSPEARWLSRAAVPRWWEGEPGGWFILPDAPACLHNKTCQSMIIFIFKYLQVVPFRFCVLVISHGLKSSISCSTSWQIIQQKDRYYSKRFHFPKIKYTRG